MTRSTTPSSEAPQSEAVQLEPIRYQMWCIASHGHDLMEHERGNLVLYADYDDLRAKYLALLSESAAQERDMAVEGLREVVARYQGNPTDGLAMAILGRDWLYRLWPEPSPTGNEENKDG